LALNLPYEYKGVAFYPVPVERIMEFYFCVDVLMVKQENLIVALRRSCPEDPKSKEKYFATLKEKESQYKKLMKMPYLYFLCYAFENWEEYGRPDFGAYIPMLYALLELTTKGANIEIKTEYKQNGEFKRVLLVINDAEFNAKDFLKIRQIIFQQSGIVHSDNFLNSDAERAIYDGRKYETKNYVPPTLEDLIDILAMYLHKSADEIINNFTIRKFNNLIKHMSKFEDYKLLKGAELGGFVSFKDKVPHFISGLKEPDVFEGLQTDYRNSNMMKV